MLRCPGCQGTDLEVTDSRNDEESNTYIRRRRRCASCKHAFTTREFIATNSMMQVEKKNGKFEMYDRRKLLQSLTVATEKRNIGLERLEAIANEIESTLFLTAKYNRIKTTVIGDFCMKKLRILDPQVSYVRYASVYKEFATAEEFFILLRSLVPARKTETKPKEKEQ